MIKYLFLILNFIGLLLVNLFFGDISVTLNVPDEVVAGNSFTVEITISKPDLKSFGRYKQDLPIGYTATPINTYNGDFTFKDHIVKIVWNPKLPSDSVFTISYNIQVDPTAEGPLNLNGSFSYIYDNEIKTMNISSKTIIIRPQGFIANNTSNQNNVNNQQSNIDTAQLSNDNIISNNFPTNEIFCYRQIESKPNGDIIVHLLINTASLSKNKFAIIQEQEIIPKEFSATNIDSKDGIFSFKDNVVKFLWISLPSEKQFQILYKLTTSTPSIELPNISGTFSYIENDATISIPIENRDFINSKALANNINNQNINQTDNTSNQNNQNNNVNNQLIKSPETGVRYKVQIAAGHNAVNPKYYFHQFNVSESVNMELHEGWHKYTIGSFTIYKDARDRRVQIWEKTPIRDAFVSAYNNGNRITVQEALMVANQKWYQ